MKNIPRKILWVFIVLIVLILGAGAYLLFTESGARMVTGIAIEKIPDPYEASISNIEGTLSNKVILKNIELNNLARLPQGSILRIQELRVHLHSLDVDTAEIEIENARLILPQSEPVLIQGTYRNGAFDLTVYSKAINVAEVLAIAKPSAARPFLAGVLGNLDMRVQGNKEIIHLTGGCAIQEMTYRDFHLSDAPLTLDLTFEDPLKDLKLSGTIDFSKGLLRARKTQIKFEPSKITFVEDPKRPRFALRGNSVIESIDIQGSFQGTMDDPEINLTSDPPLPSDLLLVMLATGKSWKGVRTAIDNEAASPDLVTDFLDYFILDGKGEKMAQAFGIKEISVTLEQNKKGIGISKGMGENVEVFYGVDQIQETQYQRTDQKIGGRVKVSETVSVTAERELKGPTAATDAQAPTDPVSDNKVMLEYKKKF